MPENLDATMRLLFAAFQGVAAGVEELLRGGLDVDSIDLDGRTALHIAACEGQGEVVRLLLDWKANINARGRWEARTFVFPSRCVNDIHKRGGTVLGTSRGGHDAKKIVDNIQDRGINQVYIIGGDGTRKGASYCQQLYLKLESFGEIQQGTNVPLLIWLYKLYDKQ